LITIIATGDSIELQQQLTGGFPQVEQMIVAGTTYDLPTNRIVGTAGDDAIAGTAGANVMAGGKGNDTYFVDNAGDVVTEVVGEGSDTVYASVGYTLGAVSEIEFLRANAGATASR